MQASHITGTTLSFASAVPSRLALTMFTRAKIQDLWLFRTVQSRCFRLVRQSPGRVRRAGRWGARERAEDVGVERLWQARTPRSKQPMGTAWEVLEALAHRPRPEDSLPEALNLGC
jgi:hypothetical protein